MILNLKVFQSSLFPNDGKIGVYFLRSFGGGQCSSKNIGGGGAFLARQAKCKNSANLFQNGPKFGENKTKQKIYNFNSSF